MPLNQKVAAQKKTTGMTVATNRRKLHMAVSSHMSRSDVS